MDADKGALDERETWAEVRRQDGTSIPSVYIDTVRAEARREADRVFEAEAVERR